MPVAKVSQQVAGRMRYVGAVVALGLYAFMSTEDGWLLGELLLLAVAPAAIDGYSRFKVAELETNTAILLHEGKDE